MPRPDLAKLFDAERHRLLALCIRLTGERTSAEDALQDTFLLAHRYASTFRSDAAPETWLYRIAIRAATHTRKRDRAARARDAAQKRRKDTDTTSTQTDEARALIRALDALPEHHRLVLTLMSLRGLPARVVAEILNVPEGTVYSRAHAARKALRGHLGRSSDDPDQDLGADPGKTTEPAGA
jgi:RNA polymerase sigma-70 factor (ECF subfamily)